MSAALYAIGRSCVRHRWAVLPVWVAMLVVTVLLPNHYGRNTSNDLTLPGTGSTNAQDLLDAKLPKQANGTNPVAMEAPHGKLTTPANMRSAVASRRDFGTTSRACEWSSTWRKMARVST